MDTPAIDVRGLVKRFETLAAVDGIDLSVRRGECFGLLGPNGAGKTTTIEILEGIQAPTGGEVRVLGSTWHEGARSLRGQIGIQLQETDFYGRLTVAETVRLFRSFYRSGLTVAEAIARVQLQEKQDVQVRKLSGGQRRRLSLAVAMAGDPQLVFLDEPTTGLDPQSRRALWDVVRELKSRGRTVLLTTHYMEEAERLCDTVAIMDRGRIITRGTPTDLIASIGGEQVVEFSAAPMPATDTVQSVPSVRRATSANGAMTLAVDEVHVALPALLARLRDGGHALSALRTRHGTLDDVFLATTGHHLREDDAA